MTHGKTAGTTMEMRGLCGEISRDDDDDGDDGDVRNGAVQSGERGRGKRVILGAAVYQEKGQREMEIRLGMSMMGCGDVRIIKGQVRRGC